MEVVDLKQDQLSWFPIGLTAEVLRVGQLVIWSRADGGVQNAGTASGIFDATGEVCLAGIVTGTDVVNETIDSTYGTPQITGLADNDTQATIAARGDHFGHEGMWSKGDPQGFVQIAMITPETRIKAPIFLTSWGTAPTELTATAVDTVGATLTTATPGFTPVANNSTTYFRTGANAGLYRISDDTSTTDPAWDKRCPADNVVGDKIVRVNVAPGFSLMQTDAEAMFIDTAAALTADYWGIIIEHLDLRFAGSEHAIFRFTPNHFSGINPTDT